MVGNRTHIIIHARYSEKTENISARFGSMELFYLYAKKESSQSGGVMHGTSQRMKKYFIYNGDTDFKPVKGLFGSDYFQRPFFVTENKYLSEKVGDFIMSFILNPMCYTPFIRYAEP